MEAQRIARRLSIIKARNGESLTEAVSKRTERQLGEMWRWQAHPRDVVLALREQTSHGQEDEYALKLYLS